MQRVTLADQSGPQLCLYEIHSFLLWKKMLELNVLEEAGNCRTRQCVQCRGWEL